MGDAITNWYPDAVWLMGVWERSPRGREIAINHESLLTSCREALPDLTPDDVVGSPYCVRRYRVDDHLGGPEGLAQARRQLARRGARLILGPQCPTTWPRTTLGFRNTQTI